MKGNSSSHKIMLEDPHCFISSQHATFRYLRNKLINWSTYFEGKLFPFCLFGSQCHPGVPSHASKSCDNHAADDLPAQRAQETSSSGDRSRPQPPSALVASARRHGSPESAAKRPSGECVQSRAGPASLSPEGVTNTERVRTRMTWILTGGIRTNSVLHVHAGDSHRNTQAAW